jgi:Protein of unknown function (DUF1761)
MSSTRHNFLAIIVATLVYFFLGAIWFTVFQQQWLIGIGRTLQELSATRQNPFLAYAIALVATFILAAFLSWLIQATGPRNLFRGVFVAIVTWLCVVFTTWSTEYAFEARGLRILAITSGYCLVGMILMGAIIGAWKQKT